jgi:dipeptidyl aminopeptidase/acylaminoacyl peptidase
MDVRWKPLSVPAPLVVILPGERTRWPDDPAGLLASALTEEGFATAVVGVRAYGDPPHPAQVRDVQSAILHLKARAVDYPIDPSRFGVLGISLGGWLAGLMATRPPLQPKAVVTWSGLLDPLTYPDHRVGTRLLGCEYRDCPTAWEQASPHVLADQYTSPWLVAQSPDERVPLDQGALLNDKLSASDVDHRLVVLPRGSGHGLAYVDRIFPETLDWFRSHL